MFDARPIHLKYIIYLRKSVKYKAYMPLKQDKV